MTAVNRWVAAHIVHESATQNEDGERIGLINRVFVGARDDRDQLLRLITTRRSD